MGALALGSLLCGAERAPLRRNGGGRARAAAHPKTAPLRRNGERNTARVGHRFHLDSDRGTALPFADSVSGIPL
ncbi:uncharacterized protein LY89DRAFT_691725 [Mollisia scopiformis]|uniref:Uncharacterized protein n=1 Tax=Mollisia scopiformis TaxID=149040 RepID=A0A132B5H4_MOLSC|nr:uncharacterized protein LY89DRAFT_691725 [Mollisia scopiformis]KUJ07666.1 hypothetical protein LY89DRAFT_691725 [Mollisia scopiformis]